jgi:hypothetical protein
LVDVLEVWSDLDISKGRKKGYKRVLYIVLKILSNEKIKKYIAIFL